ncbi:MAG: glycosyltransferase [Proteobacteria bacterium]|nr:glycosyltransferase [Pseudomonadota bacterium]
MISLAVAAQPARIRDQNDAFLAAARPHALLITNHGYPGPDVRWPASGPDSGGQITYVNKVAENLVPLGYKVTVATRAFRPDEKYAEYGDRRGVDFFENEPLARYVFVPGVEKGFVAKEQIFAELPVIAHNISHFMAEEARSAGVRPWEHVAWINSHYWDGGVIGQLVVRGWQHEVLSEWIADKFGFDPASLCNPMAGGIVRTVIRGLATYLSEDPELAGRLDAVNRHAWTSHSIGTLKRKNMDEMPRPDDVDESIRKLKEKARRWEYMAMNFSMRELVERALVGGAQLALGQLLYPDVPPVKLIAYTSAEILDQTRWLGMPEEMPLVRFPPGTEFEGFYPRDNVNHPDVQLLFHYLEGGADLSHEEKHPIARAVPAEVVDRMRRDPQGLNVIVEASRMDETKRKALLVEVMPLLPKDTILLITGMRDGAGVYDGIRARIEELGLSDRVFLIGRVPARCMGPLCSLPHGDGSGKFRLAIGASASRMEGWGMSVMDMTAGGLPLVASDMIPYATYIADKGDAAVVVPMQEGEVERYAGVFRSLIDDPAAARDLAARGREAAREFDWSELTRMFLGELEKILGISRK